VFLLREPYKVWIQGKPGPGRDFSSLACNIFGQRLRDRLAPFLVQMTAAVKRQIQSEVERVEAMRKPFTATPTPSPTPREKKAQHETRGRSFADFLVSYRP
jgi:hypothetical protein